MTVSGSIRALASRRGLARAGRRLSRVIGAAGSAPVEIESTDVITAGRHSQHNGDLRILGRQPIRFGAFCAIGNDILLVTENHDTNFLAVQGAVYRRLWSIPHPGVTQQPPNPERTKGGISIGNDVWIGDRCTILSGVTIGDGACVGANSVVTSDVEPYAMVAGVPARQIRLRFAPDVVEALLDLRWWDWDDGRIERHRDLFTTNLNTVGADEVRALGAER